MAQVSAGILLYRRREPCAEVFLIHMGGPFWARKDAGAWSIPNPAQAEPNRGLGGSPPLSLHYTHHTSAAVRWRNGDTTTDREVC